MTLVTLAGVPVSAFGLSFIASKMQPSIIGQEREMAKASKLAINSLSAIETIKCFNGQPFELGQYVAAIEKAAAFYYKQALINGLQIGFVRCITTSMFVQGFWYGSYLVRTGQASTGAVVTTFWSALMATKAWEDVLPHLNVLEKGRAAGIALKALLDTVESGRRVSKAVIGVTPKYCEGDIEVRRASFAYPSRPDHTVLHESTFFFPAGETTFVVGKSGSGKSTLGNLLMRFYKPNTGDVFVDGASAVDLDTGWLRNNITLVQQKSILFNETIFRNIAFARQDFRSVKKDQVNVCLRLAALENTINEMPKGLDTMVGSGGNSLSGGQKQRIAIARSRLRDTPILILDESTSALDYISRTAVLEAIREWRRGKTTIIITHDMTQIRDNDFVYVLAEGHVVEEGYRHVLAKAGPGGLFSGEVEVESPQIAGAPPLDFGLPPPPKPCRPRARVRFRGPGAIDILSPVSYADRDSIDLQLDTIGEDHSYYAETVPLARLNAPSRPLSRSTTRGKAFTSAVKRQSTMQGTSLFVQNPPPQQDLDLLRRRSVRIGIGTVRPMSMHQAMVMRSMYREPSLKRKSNATAASIEVLKALPREAGGPQKATISKVLGTLWPALNAGKRILLLFGFLSVLVHAAGIPSFSFIFSQLLGTFFISENQAQKALIYSMAILGISIVDAIACFLSWYLLEAVGEAWVDKLRVDAMTRVLDQPKEWFDSDVDGVSTITSSLDRNAEEMRNLVGRFAGIVVTVIAMMLIAIVWALITCWKLTVVGLSAGPALYIVTKAYERVSSKWEALTNNAAERTEAIFVEAFSDIRTVRALTLESYFHRKYTLATSTALTVGVQRAAYSGFFFGASDSMISFVTALIFWYGGLVVRQHTYSVKDILTVFAMLLFSTANATSVIAFIPQISSSIDTASRLLRLATLPLHRSHEHTGTLKSHSITPIVFSSLTFAYPSRRDAPALKDLNLTIQLGICTAIVGASGSGKSTIASLLLGLYPPGNNGTLTLAGTDIRALDLRALRAMIAVVPQTPLLFAASVRENIAYGMMACNQDEVERAAGRAGIHDFIVSLPRGYETGIGDGGLGLSGGQAQRVVIARALVRGPKVLVLDEATSALDGDSAGTVRGSLRGLVEEGRGGGAQGGGGLTVVIITHSRNMMQMADRVVVMEGGRKVEEGGFRELEGKRGGRLWEMLRVGGKMVEE